MPGNTSRVGFESLLRHREFVRSIVWRLVLDEHQVDDVVQQTWLAALRSLPPKGTLRAWLARVSRHRAADLMRGEWRQVRRETEVARPARVPSASEAFEKLTLHRQVVNAVLDLEEPYRSVVLLRFYEERPPREIAVIQGIPVATVRSRVRRALEHLRAQFDREYGGDRRSWCLAFLPLTVPGFAVPAGAAAGGMTHVAIGMPAMKTKLALCSIVLCLVATLLLIWHGVAGSSPPVDRAVVGRSLDADAPAIPLDAGDVPSGPSLTRTASDDAAEPASPSGVGLAEKDQLVGHTGDPSTSILRVVVTDENRHPLGGVKVHVSVYDFKKGIGKGYPREANQNGQVEIHSLAPGKRSWGVQVGGLYRAGHSIELVGGRVTEVTMVIPRGATVEGAVRDVEKGPLSGVVLSFQRHESHDSLTTTTDENGRYHMERVSPGIYAVCVKGKLLGHRPRHAADLVVRGLDAITRDFIVGNTSLRGSVLDTETNQPVPGVRLVIHKPEFAEATTDLCGEYRFLDLPTGACRLSLRKKGYETRSENVGEIKAGQTRYLDISMRPAAHLHLHVTDPRGHPVVGKLKLLIRRSQETQFRVQSISVVTDERGHALYSRIAPGTYFLSISGAGWKAKGAQVEIAPGDNAVRFQLEPAAAERGVPSLRGTVLDAATHQPINGVLVKVQRPVWREAHTNERGEYELRDLPAGDITVFAVRDGYATAVRKRIKVEKGKERRLDLRLLPAATLHLCVTDSRGQPVPGRVTLVHVAAGRGETGSGTLQADGEGRATYRRILPGHYKFTIWSEEHGRAEIEKEILPDENTLDVQLE